MTRKRAIVLAFASAGVLGTAVFIEMNKRPIDSGPGFFVMRTESVVLLVGATLLSYKEDFGQFPESLSVLSEDRDGGGPYMRATEVVDGWKQPLVYRPAPGHHPEFVLYSVGENGNDEGGAGDDISFWSKRIQKQL